MDGSRHLEFGEERRRRKHFVQFSFWSGAVLLAAILTIAGILKLPFLRVKGVEIVGAKQSQGDAARLLFESQVIRESWANRFLGADNFLAWPKSFDAEELQFIPSLRSASVIKDYGENKIVVRLTERTPTGIWCFKTEDPERCFWFDDQGIIFKPAFSSEGNLIKVVNDYSDKASGLGNSVLQTDFLPSLFSILHFVEDSGIGSKEIAIRDISLEEAEVDTVNGPKLLFSLRFPVEGADEVVKSLHNRKLWNALEYVDFRVEHRAYYK